MQSVKIDSVPQGAKVFTSVASSGRQPALLRRKEVGITPMTVSITRKDGVVELEKEGYRSTRVPMHRELNPWFLGNIVMTSMLSSSIDTSTGAVSEYDPGQYLVELERDETWKPGIGTPSVAPAVPAASAKEAEDEPWVPDVRPLNPPPARTATPTPAAPAPAK